MAPFAIYWTCLFFVGVILLLHRCFVIIDLQCEKKTLFGKIQAKGEQSIGCYMLYKFDSLGIDISQKTSYTLIVRFHIV